MLEEVVAHALRRDPSEVFLAVTEEHEQRGPQPERVLYRWSQESGLTRRLPNPLLDAAWARYPWARPLDARASGSASGPAS